MKVHLAYPEHSKFNSWEKAFLPILKEELHSQQEGSKYTFEPDPEEAEIIVLLESNTFKTHRHIENLKRETILNKFPDKVFTINYEDKPAGFLPGLYTGLNQKSYNPIRHKSWPALFIPNENVYTIEEKIIKSVAPQYLFSFRGALSHRIRKRIQSKYISKNKNHKIIITEKWYNHNQAEKKEYVNDILKSKFVLCPCGLQPYSHRIPEVMALGRVPVIIADDWIPFANIEWDKCSVLIQEKDADDIERKLREVEGNSTELGLMARYYWNKYFSKSNRIAEALDLILQIKDERTPEYNEGIYRKQWESRKFYKLNGWAIEQRIYRKLLKSAENILSGIIK